MAQKRFKFSVSTSSFCFLCFDNISINNNSSSLQNVFQYLNISLGQIKALSTKPVKLLNRTDVRVCLCNECEKTFQEISKLYKIIEQAQLKLDFNFEVVQNRLRSSKQCKGEKYQTKLKETNDELFIRHSKLVTELKDEILGKCDMRMPNYYPKVTLERIAESVILGLRKNQIKDEHGGRPCKEDVSIRSAFNPKKSFRVIEDLLSVPIPEVYTVKQEEKVDLEHVNAMDEPETDGNDDLLEEEKLFIGKHCKLESNPNRKINYKSTPNRRKKRFAGPVQVDLRTCHICKEVHSTRQNLLDHLRMHSKETSFTFQCLYQRQQIAEKKWTCTVCKKSLSTNQRLKEHLKIHSNEKPFQCKFCPKRFITNDSLRRHSACHAESMEIVPVSMLKFQCNICHKICSTKQHLKSHARIHNKVKAFPCKLCGMGFAFKSRLKLHLKSHLTKF